MTNNDNTPFDVIIAALVAACIIATCLCSCASTHQVNDNDHIRTQYIHDTRVDSIMLHDSIYIRETQRNDTIRIVEYRYKDRVRYVQRTDTLVLTDTLRIKEIQERIAYRTPAVAKPFVGLGIAALIYILIYILRKFKVF